MKNSKLTAKYFRSNLMFAGAWLLIGTICSCHFTTNADAKKTKTERGPFKPYGGRRERTYNKDTSMVEVREYDARGFLRRQRTARMDKRHRIIFGSEEVFDEKNSLVRGYQLTRSYKDELDLDGKTSYSRYDTQTKTFRLVPPLVPGYEQTMITKPPPSLGLDVFYQKYVDANGIPVASSSRTPNAALLIARDIVNYLLMKRTDVREELIRRKSRVLVMAESEMETDLPERRDWKKPDRNDPRLTPFERENYDKPWGIGHMTDKGYWNQRARGMGGNEVSCAEENLLGYAGTRYYGENILVHEFSHNIMSALESTDPALYSQIEQAYEAALAKGIYKDQYAINTVNEYWAEGTQWWFWSNIEFYDGETRVQSPDDLKAYDSTLYHIFERVYAGHHIPADVYYGLNLAPVR